MLIRTGPAHPIPPSEITPRAVWEERRAFLRLAAAAGVGAGLGIYSGGTAALAERPGVGRPIAPLRETPFGRGLKLTDYEDATSYNNFVELGSGKGAPARNAHLLRTRPWTVRVEGACERPGEMGIEEILSGFDQEERIYRFRCVEAWAMVVPWVGFPLGRLLKRFAPTSKARYVAFESLYDPDHLPGQRRSLYHWPYREGLTMEEAMHPLTLLATGLYGEELPAQNGAPLRLVVPWKYGFKSIKSIVAIRFTEEIPTTTWWQLQPQEYGFFANVNPEVDHPRWSQRAHRMIGEGIFARKQPTLMFNGYGEQVADLYRGLDLHRFY